MVTAKGEVGRHEAEQRRLLNKAFALEIKKHAKGTAWRVSKGVLFRELDGWFVSAPAAVWVLRRKTQIELRCKPMALDPIFWEIVETESNGTMPLSFRYHGAWTCSTPALVEYELEESSGDPVSIAAQVQPWLDSQVEQFRLWTTDHFLQQLQQHPRSNSYLATTITAMCLLGDYISAALICHDAINREDACGFSISPSNGRSRTFPELALAWLARKRGSFH